MHLFHGMAEENTRAEERVITKGTQRDGRRITENPPERLVVGVGDPSYVSRPNLVQNVIKTPCLEKFHDPQSDTVDRVALVIIK
ncbi:hypothetical protein TNCV_2291711 [Trichonephila clavipes]|uniref:Uncharacterized protein n=1 Tax=Trichonephila clavipes TaxID=2585209 RepID=A0A8X6V205_TRICX|nr:hypothetical protein TNCV_2291711 [Trichonephila clavipes]